MDNAIPPSAAAAPDELTSLLQGAIELPLPFPTDNGGGDDFVNERSDGEGNEVVQLLGGAEEPDRDYPDLLDPGVAGLAEVPVPEILQKFQQLGGGEGGVADLAAVTAAAAAGALLLLLLQPHSQQPPTRMQLHGDKEKLVQSHASKLFFFEKFIDSAFRGRV
eukprot:3411061-Rhodomonas_salina.1